MSTDENVKENEVIGVEEIIDDNEESSQLGKGNGPQDSIEIE